MGGCVSKSTSPEPLSIEGLLRARACLQSQKKLTADLMACFNLALSEFSEEPLCVQENARMTIQSGTRALVFVSGMQENEISVFQLEGQVQYQIKIARWDTCLARVFSKNIVKTVAEMAHYIPAGPVLEMVKKMVQS